MSKGYAAGNLALVCLPLQHRQGLSAACGVVMAKEAAILPVLIAVVPAVQAKSYRH
jgi:hypothetical protein